MGKPFPPNLVRVKLCYYYGAVIILGVGTRGARGARPPNIKLYKSGAPPAPPPQCWSYQRYFNCENGFFLIHIPAKFCNICLGSSTKNLYIYILCFTRIKKCMCTPYIMYTVKPVLMATCIQRPPVLRGHSVMSQRCLRNNILTCIQRPPLYKGHYEVALAWPFNTGFTVHVLCHRKKFAPPPPTSSYSADNIVLFLCLACMVIRTSRTCANYIQSYSLVNTVKPPNNGHHWDEQ